MPAIGKKTGKLTRPPNKKITNHPEPAQLRNQIARLSPKTQPFGKL
jgi:hypothetical protein